MEKMSSEHRQALYALSQTYSQQVVISDDDFVYDYLSGAVAWKDEMVGVLDYHSLGLIRQMFAYRMGLLTNTSMGAEFGEWWRCANEAFGSWIGFSQARTQYNPTVVEYLTRRKLMPFA